MNDLYRIATLLSRVLPRALEWVVLSLLLWVLSGFFWQLFSPSLRLTKLDLPKSIPTLTRSGIAVLNEWFVVPDKGKKVLPPINWKLQAVISDPDGIAILSGVQGSTVAVRVGSDIEPGSRLLAVEANQVWIERGGQRQALALPTTSPNNPTLGMQRPTTIQQADYSAPVQQSLSRSEVAAALQGGNMANWDKGISSLPDGGLRIDAVNTQPLARIFNLREGDVIKSVNQRPLSQIADVSLVYNSIQQPSLELAILRDNRSYTLRYQIQP